MDWIVTRLGATECAQMRDLNALFADAFEDAATYTAAPPTDAYLADVLQRPDVIALAVERDGVILGGLVAYVLAKLEQQRREVYIYDLAVRADMRRQGMARALIAETRAIAARIGASVVYVQADPEDAPAVTLYTTFGTRADVLHFDIPPKPRD